MTLLSVENFLTLLDHAIDLIKSQKQSREELFNNVIDPLFIELRPVIDDYFALFRRTRQKVINSTAANLWESIAEVKENRESLLLSRIKIREMAEVMSSVYHDGKINSFANKVLEFFYGTEIRAKSKISGGEELVHEFTNYVMGNNVTKERLLDFIDKTLAALETKWVAICQNYASLRIYCLNNQSPPSNPVNESHQPHHHRTPWYKYIYVFLTATVASSIPFASSRIIQSALGTEFFLLFILILFAIMFGSFPLTAYFWRKKWKKKKPNHLTFEFVTILTGISIVTIPPFSSFLFLLIVSSGIETWTAIIVLFLPFVIPLLLLPFTYHFSVNLHDLIPSVANLVLILAQFFGATVTIYILFPTLGIYKSLYVMGSILVTTGIYGLWKTVQKLEQN